MSKEELLEQFLKLKKDYQNTSNMLEVKRVKYNQVKEMIIDNFDCESGEVFDDKFIYLKELPSYDYAQFFKDNPKLKSKLNKYKVSKKYLYIEDVE